MRLFRRIRAQFKLTRARHYLDRRTRDLAWDQEIHGHDHRQEIADLTWAAMICWKLSWMV